MNQNTNNSLPLGNTKISNQQKSSFITRIVVERYNIMDAALLSDIRYDNAAKICRKYASTGIIEKVKTGNTANKKVTDDIKSYIETLVEDMPSIVLSEIRLKILNEKNL